MGCCTRGLLGVQRGRLDRQDPPPEHRGPSRLLPPSERPRPTSAQEEAEGNPRGSTHHPSRRSHHGSAVTCKGCQAYGCPQPELPVSIHQVTRRAARKGSRRGVRKYRRASSMKDTSAAGAPVLSGAHHWTCFQETGLVGPRDRFAELPGTTRGP